ncbi:hypothetical protein LguiA_010932 [Lonicera macranthoides]
MRKNQNYNNKAKKNTNDNSSTNGFIPSSFRFISSCIKTVSSNVRSAGATVAGSISGDSDEHHKDQVTSFRLLSRLFRLVRSAVAMIAGLISGDSDEHCKGQDGNPGNTLDVVLWACFDRLELNSSTIKRVLLLGYSNGFQVLDVEDSSNVSELVSKRDDPVTFLQMQPIPEQSKGCEGFSMSHPLLLVVASEETSSLGPMKNGRDVHANSQMGNLVHSPTAVRFYSLRSHNYVHVLRFRSTVYMVRCSPRIVAVGLAAQIYCFDALTLENKFSVLTYPVPQLGGQGLVGVNIGYGPMAVGSRWLAYASNNPLLSNTGRLSPQNLSPSPGVSPSTSPGSGSLMARYAMESSKHLATGLINLGDMGYKTLSKYCHDGSNSPVSSNSSWKVGRVAVHPIETDAAGMVVIKDFVSRAVVSQFRAHTSPISALCFDPSGTLLVTASITGNNINIFRIMPSSCLQNGSGTRSYDWNSSHVHLYKLHRGMTSAVIQDICFSQYSQWIAIVSSRGTCHIFVLSPFGGETGLQMQNSRVSGATLLPVLSVPWWSTSSFTKNNSFSPPPPAPTTLSVVSRIKNGNGWLNAVSNAASSTAVNASVPSGVVAAVFHNSVSLNSQPPLPNTNTLEHLMVYSPSGNVIQYDLVPSVGGEQDESPMKSGAGLMDMQEEDLRVKVETIQWWDVCRRTDWPEREERIYEHSHVRDETVENPMDTSDYEDKNDAGGKDVVKAHEQCHWHLSNAEVQMRSGRIPVWQKSKIYFYTMSPLGPGYEEMNLSKEYAGGEIEIEKVPVHEVEMRRKDLLPVFDRFHSINSDWSGGRGLGRGRFSASSSYEGDKEKFSEDTVLSHAKLLSPGSVENSLGGSLRTQGAAQNVNQPYSMKSYPRIFPSTNENGGVKSPCYIEESYVINSSSSLSSGPLSNGGTIQSKNSGCVTSDVSNTSSNRSDSSMNIIYEGPVHEDIMHSNETLDFGQYFREGYCKADTHPELMEDVTDVDGGGNGCHKEKSEEDDGDSDDMLGGVFDFSEEGEESEIIHIL